MATGWGSCELAGLENAASHCSSNPLKSGSAIAMPKEQLVVVKATHYFRLDNTTDKLKHVDHVRVTCDELNWDGPPPDQVAEPPAEEVREKKRKRRRSESVDQVEPEGRRRMHRGREKKKKRVSSRSSSRTPEVCKQHRTRVVHPQVGEQLRDRVQPQEEGTNSRLRAGGVCAGEGRERGGEKTRAGTSDREDRREVSRSETRRERDSPLGKCNPGDAGAGPVRVSGTSSPARTMIPTVGAGWMYEQRPHSSVGVDGYPHPTIVKTMCHNTLWTRIGGLGGAHLRTRNPMCHVSPHGSLRDSPLGTVSKIPPRRYLTHRRGDGAGTEE